MPAPPAVADTNDDGYLDVAYIGDLNGRMWKLDLTPSADTTAPRGVLSSGTLQYQPFLLYDGSTSTTQPIQPVFLEAGIIFVSGGAPPTLGVGFGTGNRAQLLSPNVRPDPNNPSNTIPFVNRFHFVIDKGSGTTLHETDLVNITPNGGVTSAGTGPGVAPNGYFLDFATFNEKAVSTVFSTRGSLSLVTFSPDSGSVCSSAGASFRYRLLFATGQGGYSTVVSPPSGAGSLQDYRQQIANEFVSTTQSVTPLGGIIDISLSQGGGLSQQNTPGTLKTINQSWKEQ